MRLLRALLVLIMAGLSAAYAAGPAVLPAEQAFALTAERAPEGLVLTWRIAPETYLYRDQIAARSDAAEAVAIATPQGEMKDDPNFGPVEIFREALRASVAAADIPSGASLTVTFQGCTEGGLCYPPVHRAVDLTTLAVSAGAAPALAEPAAPFASLVQPEDGRALLDGGPFALTMLAFLGFGLLLSLTPCIYPMVPIMLGILAGRDDAAPGPRRGLILSGAYVLAMASAYAVLGVAAAWSGVNLQAVLQAPWALGLMAAVLAVLALSMFGAFELSLPALTRSGGGTQRGGVLRAAGLGFGAALVVGPCVTPPLAAALLYIAQSGDPVKGAAALFALGLGMGLPLLLVGLFGARLLPRSGAWLVKMRQLFGFAMLGAGIVLLARVLPGQVSLLLWSALALAVGVFLGAFDRLTPRHRLPPRMLKAAGLIAVIYGTALAIGASAGGQDPLRPLAGFVAGAGAPQAPAIEKAATINSPQELTAALAARRDDKPVFVQVTADWCTICKDIERDVLADAAVRAALAGFTLIRADVTRDGEGSRALMKQLAVIGPPTLLVLDARTGREIPAARITGMTSPAAFLARLAAARASAT